MLEGVDVGGGGGGGVCGCWGARVGDKVEDAVEDEGFGVFLGLDAGGMVQGDSHVAGIGGLVHLLLVLILVVVMVVMVLVVVALFWRCLMSGGGGM